MRTLPDSQSRLLYHAEMFANSCNSDASGAEVKDVRGASPRPASPNTLY